MIITVTGPTAVSDIYTHHVSNLQSPLFISGKNSVLGINICNSSVSTILSLILCQILSISDTAFFSMFYEIFQTILKEEFELWENQQVTFILRTKLCIYISLVSFSIHSTYINTSNMPLVIFIIICLGLMLSVEFHYFLKTFDKL